MRSFNIIAGLCLLLACSCRQRNGIITNAGLVKQRLSTLACYDGQPVISPDGKFLAFVSSQLGDRHIFTLELESEQRDALTVNEGIDEEPRFSPDNQQVVFVSRIGGRSDLWIIDKDENLLQLTKTEYDQESFPCWSADGKQIYFVVSMAYGSEIRRVLRTNFTDVATVLTDSLQFGKLWNDPAGRWLFAERRSREQSDIVKIDLGNPSVTRFVNSTYVEKSPAISPDGQWLAYISNASGFDEIWITPTDNVLPIQVTFDSTSHDNPTWSEDGQSLFFEETSNWDIKITDVETQVESVLVGHRMNDEAPVFSADGQTLYFVSDRNGKKGIYALDMQSTLVDPVLVDDYNNFDPELSPDGREMVFTSDRTGIRHLWLRQVRADSVGSYMVGVTQDSFPCYQARFSPDGNRLLFVSERAGSPDIWIKDLRMGTERQITIDPHAELHPCFSINDLILFSANWAGRWSIWHAPVGGGIPLPVTRDKTPYGFDDEPIPSTDGNRLLFTRAWYDDKDIWLMSLSGGERTTRTVSKDNTNQEMHGRWSPDGKSAVYQSGHNTDLWKIDVSPLLK